MNKIFKLLGIFFVLVLAISGCGKDEIEQRDNSFEVEDVVIDPKTVLQDVLDNKITFITEEQQKVYLYDYETDFGKAIPIEFVFVDLDDDKINELVVNVSESYGCYLVLHYNGTDVYGYEFVPRALLNLKTDGTFAQSGGAANTNICKMQFVDDKCEIVNILVVDEINNVFELNGSVISKDEADKFFDSWNNIDNVIWEKIEENIGKDKVIIGELSTNDALVQSINLNDYISYEITGYNGYAKISVFDDREQFYLDNINKIDFKNSDVKKVWYELHNAEDSVIDAYYKNVFNFDAYMEGMDLYCYDFGEGVMVASYDMDGFSNGDVVTLKWDIDQETMNTYFVPEFICENIVIKVSGLENKPVENKDIVVPDVVGMDSDSAKEILENLDLAVIREYDYSDTVPSGNVISQSVPANEILTKGEAVRICVSQGAEKVKVPSVIGKSENDVKNILKDSGLCLGNVTYRNESGKDPGIVIEQNPACDQYIERGSWVDIVISK